MPVELVTEVLWVETGGVEGRTETVAVAEVVDGGVVGAAGVDGGIGVEGATGVEGITGRELSGGSC